MNITVEIKTMYGEIKVYPVCDAAKAFAAIAGTKTLTAVTLKWVRELGCTVKQQHTEFAI